MPPDVLLWEFPFRPIPNTCASRIAHDLSAVDWVMSRFVVVASPLYGVTRFSFFFRNLPSGLTV